MTFFHIRYRKRNSLHSRYAHQVYHIITILISRNFSFALEREHGSFVTVAKTSLDALVHRDAVVQTKLITHGVPSAYTYYVFLFILMLSNEYTYRLVYTNPRFT